MRSIKKLLAKQSGRNSSGKVTVRHQGGRVKRFLRVIDNKRDKKEIWGRIQAVEYDPNRNGLIGLTVYEDGEKRYTLLPVGVTANTKIIASEMAPIEVGNSLPLGKIPAGTGIYNIEIVPGKGGQLVKSAGSVAVIQGKENEYTLVKMPSGELRRFRQDVWATVGQVSNVEARNRRLGKAGLRRKMGIRPTVRGVAMHPKAHPHGGGEGRSSVGMKAPKTPWGKPAVGKTRNKKKYSNSFIVTKRKGKRGQ